MLYFILAQLPKNLLQYGIFILWAVGWFPWIDISVAIFNAFFAALTVFYLVKVFRLPLVKNRDETDDSVKEESPIGEEVST